MKNITNNIDSINHVWNPDKIEPGIGTCVDCFEIVKEYRAANLFKLWKYWSLRI